MKPTADSPGQTPASAAIASPASLRRRLAAVVYEALVMAALLFVASFAALPFTASLQQARHDLAIPSAAARAGLFLFFFAVLAAYCVHFWTGSRRTLAMKTWGLRLLRRDGAPLDARTAVARYVAGWIGPALCLLAYVATRGHAGAAHALWLLGFNFAWALVDRDRQFLHDRLAGTLLVMDPARRAPI